MKTPDRALLPLPKKDRAAIGILGGIFDPVHNGHLAIATLAYDYFNLKSVFLIPSGNPPHKSGSVTAATNHRLTMLLLATKGSKQLVVRDEEIKRKGVSYTVDTITALQKEFPHHPLHFIIGSDNLREIKTWHRYEDIISSVTLCVAHRPGNAMTVPHELAKATILTFPSPEWGISSSMVREYLSKGYSCEHLIPAKVISYIKMNKLYRRGGA
jgi:nicotinate-nucleotide adenylyltransferase